ncbi:exopolygalacturonase isoform X1 [Glycine max]|nr:exopolygalacturonase isoform X1 [Glycine max]XP_040874119.1 exopolygalacturonase isoform X1 [Glycine max]|eukprot:XP_003532865.3 exopolygalacturonase [Glycine max]
MGVLVETQMDEMNEGMLHLLFVIGKGYEFWAQTLCLGLWFHRSHLQRSQIQGSHTHQLWLSEEQGRTSLRKDAHIKLFNVAEYGAIADGKEDNSVAFLKAWSDACKWNGSATVLIPKGTYMLKSVIFKGPCNDSITFQIKGVLKAPIDPSLLTDQKWINFRYIDQLNVNGGGTLDGQGSATRRKCKNNANCEILFTTMDFDFITNGHVQNLHSIDSKGGHFIVFGCENMTFTDLTLKSPEHNRNTDGIKIAQTNGINITSVKIGTGDDCVAMISGTKNAWISNVVCGPGHGISVGSLGKNDGETDVEDIVVKNCTFVGTSNGLRIKTWAAPLKKTLNASNFVYEDIVMNSVQNPIVIDQQYCPLHQCDLKEISHVQISNVTYRNIRGSSETDIAVNFNCSKDKPCQKITLDNINLWRYGVRGKGRPLLRNNCFKVEGASYGKQTPPSCIAHRATPLST